MSNVYKCFLLKVKSERSVWICSFECQVAVLHPSQSSHVCIDVSPHHKSFVLTVFFLYRGISESVYCMFLWLCWYIKPFHCLGHISIILHLCIYLRICGIFRCLSRYRWTRTIMTDPSSQTKCYEPCPVDLVWLFWPDHMYVCHRSEQNVSLGRVTWNKNKQASPRANKTKKATWHFIAELVLISSRCRFAMKSADSLCRWSFAIRQ